MTPVLAALSGNRYPPRRVRGLIGNEPSLATSPVTRRCPNVYRHEPIPRRQRSEEAFENVWLSRDSQLDTVPGFVEFRLLKGPEAEDHTLYASHTVWV